MAASASQVFQEGAPQICTSMTTKSTPSQTHKQRTSNNSAQHSTPGGEHAYVLYRAMSAYAHPSDFLVDHYAELADNPMGVTLRMEPVVIDHDSWWHVCCVHDVPPQHPT